MSYIKETSDPSRFYRPNSAVGSCDISTTGVPDFLSDAHRPHPVLSTLFLALALACIAIFMAACGGGGGGSVPTPNNPRPATPEVSAALTTLYSAKQPNHTLVGANVHTDRVVLGCRGWDADANCIDAITRLDHAVSMLQCDVGTSCIAFVDTSTALSGCIFEQDGFYRWTDSASIRFEQWFISGPPTTNSRCGAQSRIVDLDLADGLLTIPPLSPVWRLWVNVIPGVGVFPKIQWR